MNEESPFIIVLCDAIENKLSGDQIDNEHMRQNLK